MNLVLENLELIPKLLEAITALKSQSAKSNEKRWLNSNEMASYTGYKLETIKSKVKSGDFVRRYHYFKRDGKLLFDKLKVDDWVMGIKPISNDKNQQNDVDTLVEGIISSTT